MFSKLVESLVGSERMEQMRSVVAYDSARKARLAKLAQWRADAAREINFVYPDAACLIDAIADTFMAYSKAGDAFIIGRFADYVYPKLAAVSADASAKERRQAVFTYTLVSQALSSGSDEVDQYIGECANFLFHGHRPSDNELRNLFKKGYIYLQYDSRFVVGATLHKDDDEVCSANEYTGLPHGGLNGALYRAVTDKKKFCQTSDIEFTVKYYELGDGPGDENGFTVHIIYAPNTDSDKDMERLEPLSKFVAATQHLFVNSAQGLVDEYWLGPEE